MQQIELHKNAGCLNHLHASLYRCICPNSENNNYDRANWRCILAPPAFLCGVEPVTTTTAVPGVTTSEAAEVSTTSTAPPTTTQVGVITTSSRKWISFLFLQLITFSLLHDHYVGIAVGYFSEQKKKRN